MAAIRQLYEYISPETIWSTDYWNPEDGKDLFMAGFFQGDVKNPKW